MYTADYPEKCLVTTIRDQGKLLCPSDLTPESLLDQMGTDSARDFQRANPRCDTIARRKSVERARNFIHKKGYVVNSRKVDDCLQEESYVPTKNAFSDPRNNDDVFSLPSPDPMHEGGAGTWLATLQHLVRILHSFPDGEERIIKLNQRLRAVGSFGHDVVRQLSENVADLTLMKIYEYESALKDAPPCFENLFPDAVFDSHVQDLLFTYARWYTLVKLRMHTDSTLRQLDGVTSDVGNMLRRLQVTSAEKFKTVETPAEAAKRVRSAHNRGATNVSSTRRPKTLNLSTYKFHSMGHVVPAIARLGTTPNYTTSQNELSLREPIGDYQRTSGKGYEAQIVRSASIKTAHFHMRHALERLGVMKRRDELPEKHPKARGEDVFKGDPVARYHLAKGENDRTRLKDLKEQYSQDPAFKDFRGKLQDHCLARLLGGVSSTSPVVPPEDRSTLKIHKESIYTHSRIAFNYTTYDVRRAQDPIQLGTSNQHVMLLSDEDEGNSHPFWYARVVGIFHVNVSHAILSPEPQRMDALFVRWFGYDPAHAAGWKARRLDRIGFIPGSDPDAFGFIDPAIVIRACHLLAGFAHGQTDKLLGPSQLRDCPEGDWRYYYVSRFADNDMLMRFTNLGVGHAGNYPTHMDMREPLPIPEITLTLGKGAEIPSDEESDEETGPLETIPEEDAEQD